MKDWIKNTISVAAILALVIACSVSVACMIFNMYMYDQIEPSTDELTMSLQWACFDGCFNMLEVQYDTIDYHDQDRKQLHDGCCSMCAAQYPWDNELY